MKAHDFMVQIQKKERNIQQLLYHKNIKIITVSKGSKIETTINWYTCRPCKNPNIEFRSKKGKWIPLLWRLNDKQVEVRL